jgi:predicted exporter
LNKPRLAAALWAAVVLAALGSLGLQVARGFRVESGLLALLPGDAQKPAVGAAVQRMADAGSRRVVILVGHTNLEKAGLAADACAAQLKGQPGIAHALARVEGDFAAKARDFYLPLRYQLLTPSQRKRLENQSDKDFLEQALQSLYAPMGPPRLAPLESDPFGLFSEALLEAASRSAIRTAGDRLILADGGMTYVLVLVELAESSVSLAEQRGLLDSFNRAAGAAKAAGAQDLLRAGFVFHAAEAARQAERELSTIGLGSLLGILLAVWLVFRSLKPLALTLLPIAVGCAVAVAAGQLLFGRLHLLTLVFGSSIIGVAVDYGMIFLAGLAGDGPWDPAARRRAILPPVAMALGTSLLAYGALAAMPFPILRQMGAFTLLGLSAAWLTAVLWLPLMAGGLRPVKVDWLRLDRWPRVGRNAGLRWGLAALALLSLAGLARLNSNDDIRQLYASAPETVRQQEAVQRLMRLPATGQFFLVNAPDEQALLEREEALADDLDRRGVRYQSVSQFVPSLKRQAADRVLQQRLYNPKGLAGKFFKALESPETTRVALKQAAAPVRPLLPSVWLASPLSTPFRALWLGPVEGSWTGLVSLSGVDAAGLKSLAGIQLAGVEFVDHPAALSALLGRFRVLLQWLLAGGYTVVALALWIRYRREAWRALLPTLLACLYTAGLFAWLGLNANLFFVFGILLSLDMGVDYSIYLQEKGAGGLRVSFLGASLAALATLLSFGLLALSQTPALKTFGLTVLLGIGGSWLLAPCFAKGWNDEK